MTTRQKFEQMLYDMGIFETQAKEIMDFAIEEIDLLRTPEDPYQITWNRPASEYPEAFYNVVFGVKIKPQVFAWANENMPMAWWKPMFAENMTV
jgi:hypothetical protein